MNTAQGNPNASAGPWDEEHVKALLHFPRFPARLIQNDPWQAWIVRHGGLKSVFAYLQKYPLSPSHRRILEVVLSSPDEISDVYANRLNISRATYFYQLRELLPFLVQALNQWESEPAPELAELPEIPPAGSSSLPVPVTSLIGAEKILTALVPLLEREDVRLLTLLGPGGIGKTRVSIELAGRLAERFAGNICFVDLSPLRDPVQLLPAIGQALGMPKTSDLRELKKRFSAQPHLLLLDNFEHLLSASALVTELLAGSTGLKILITSRAALRVYGEHEFVVPPLAVPAEDSIPDPGRLAQNPSVALFEQRARAVDPGFALSPDNAEAVYALCRFAEGIPLILELAAYQAKYFSPQAILVRLANSRRLNFLSRGPRRLHPQQQTPRDILDWSYNLLSADLQGLFRRLSMFPGGFTIDAAEAVCAPGDSAPQRVQAGLTALTDQSLLEQHAEAGGEPRFHMFEITREYALEQLESAGELASVSRAFAAYYLDFAEKIGASPEPSGPRAWIEKLHREYPNIQAAIQWTIDQHEGELGLRYVSALWNYWKFRGNQAEGRRITQTILEQTVEFRRPIRALVQRLAGWLAHDVRDYTAMLGSFQASLDLSEELQDRVGAGLARQGLGELAQLRGQWDLAREHIQASLDLFRELDDRLQIAWSVDMLGRIEFGRGRLAEAQDLFGDALDKFCAIDAQSAAAFALSHLGQAVFYQGGFESARAFFEESLARSSAAGDARSPVIAVTKNYLAEISVHTAQSPEAEGMISQSLGLSREAGYTWCGELGNFTAALLAMREGGYSSAGSNFQNCLLLQQSLREYWRMMILLEMVSSLLVLQHEWLAAARLYGAAAALRTGMQIPAPPVYAAGHERDLGILREQLKGDVFEDAWLAGQSLNLDDAFIYALRCLE
jgi:predicted ATPase